MQRLVPREAWQELQEWQEWGEEQEQSFQSRPNFSVPACPQRYCLLKPVCGCAGAGQAMQAQYLARLLEDCWRVVDIERLGTVLLRQLFAVCTQYQRRVEIAG